MPEDKNIQEYWVVVYNIDEAVIQVVETEAKSKEEVRDTFRKEYNSPFGFPKRVVLEITIFEETAKFKAWDYMRIITLIIDSIVDIKG